MFFQSFHFPSQGCNRTQLLTSFHLSFRGRLHHRSKREFLFYLKRPKERSKNQNPRQESWLTHPSQLSSTGSKACKHWLQCPNIVVIIHINIENHLFVSWDECLFIASIMAVRRDVVNCSHIDLVRHSAYQSVSKSFGVFKAKVSAVNIICKRE